MHSDLRYLIYLNIALVAISGYAAFVSFQKSATNPNWYDVKTIEKTIANGTPDELAELATTLSTGLGNRVAAVRSDRKRAAILSIFTALVGGSNLWLITWLYRRSRTGLFMQDGVMIESE